jgi:acetyl esterase/lipase
MRSAAGMPTMRAMRLDSSFKHALDRFAAALSAEQMPEIVDALSRRTVTEARLARLAAAQPASPDVVTTDLVAVVDDGASIPLRWYVKRGSTPGAAVVYLHGGGTISGSIDHFDRIVSRYVSDSGVPMLAVDYRLAPEHPHPTPVEDCYAGFQWLVTRAADLGVDASRIGIMGDSAGGGLAAAVAILARERGDSPPSRQLLIYPMLDDRTVVADAALDQFASWRYVDNAIAWDALLGTTAGGPDVPASAAPARATDLSGLPPAYVEVGQLDIFRDESIAYAQRLSQAGVDVELHVHPGVAHVFDLIAPDADVTHRARADRLRVIASL